MYQALITYRYTNEAVGTYHEIKTAVYDDPDKAKLEAIALVHRYYANIHVIAVEIEYYAYQSSKEIEGIEQWN